MKKFLLFLLTVSLFACSGDDSNDTVNNGSSLTPPSWIHGTWGIDNGQPLFKFTSNNVCQLAGSTEFCLVEHVNDSNEHNVPASLSQESDNNKYYVTLTFEGGMIYHYDFEKISDTEIKWVSSPTPNAILTKL